MKINWDDSVIDFDTWRTSGDRFYNSWKRKSLKEMKKISALRLNDRPVILIEGYCS